HDQVSSRATLASLFPYTTLFRSTSPDDTFGGLSGLAMPGPGQEAVFVSDRGHFVSGQFAYDDLGRLFGFIGVEIEPMRNSQGALDRKSTRLNSSHVKNSYAVVCL